jgi:antirestriction protein ArdC
MKVQEIITQQVIDALERGVIPWRKPWVGGENAPQNLETKRKYSGINPFLLSLTAFSSPYFLTANQVKKLGGAITPTAEGKTPLGTPIVFWGHTDSKTDKNKDGTPASYGFLRYYRVYNTTQCTGLDKHIPTPDTKPADWSPIPGAEAIIDGYVGQLSGVSYTSNAATYSPRSDCIAMPPKESFPVREGFYSTMFHEMIHSTGHETRLDRFKKTPTRGRYGSPSVEYSKEELVAEMGAAFLSAECGIIDETLDQSAAYCLNWAERLKGDAKLNIISAASQAWKGHELILNKK